MTSPGAPAKPSWAGKTPVLWQGWCPDVWSLKRGLPQKLSSRDLGGVLRFLPQETWCWCRPEGTCDPGQAGFSASLINAVPGPVQLDWSRSCVPLNTGPKIPWRVLWGPWGCLQTPCPRCSGAGADRKLFIHFLG